jgi:hypothetical protein
MMNTMILGLPGESHGRRQSISVVLSLIHRRQLLLNRSLTKYRADRSTSRLTKWWHEFSLLVLLRGTCGGCPEDDPRRNASSAIYPPKWIRVCRVHLPSLAAAKSLCSKIHFLLRTSAVMTIECDRGHIQVLAGLLAFAGLQRTGRHRTYACKL